MKGGSLRRASVPLFLLLCLLFGGSVQAVWGNMVLQLIALGLIAWAAVAPKHHRNSVPFRLLIGLVVLSLLLIVLQLVPLPPKLWAGLPGRGPIVAGYETLGYELPWQPISLDPYRTLATALTLLPPIAVLAAMVRLRAYEERWIAWAILGGTFLAVLLGAVQVAGGRAGAGWWYLYDITNRGAVGFFANRNHMATLLLVAIPFAVALFAAARTQAKQKGRTAASLVVGAAGFLLILVGLALNRSLAAAALAVPVIAASALLLPTGWRFRRLTVPAAALTMIGAIVLLAGSPIQAELAGPDAVSVQKRSEMWRTTTSAVADTFPVGTGAGTFEQVYALYERPETVTATHVNHAHNDYLELLLETGLAGGVLLLLFLLWWGREAARVWQSPLGTHFAKASTIASAAILAHSVVDYPLRTTALATVFAALIALMAQPPRQRQDSGTSDLRPTRHVAIG